MIWFVVLWIKLVNLLDRIVDNDDDNEWEIKDDNSSTSSSNSLENDNNNAIETDEDNSSTLEASNQDESNQIDELKNNMYYTIIKTNITKQ